MELTHTLEVEPNWFTRLFFWFYGMGVNEELNTCKLFWGTLGIIVIPPIIVAISPMIALVLALGWIGDTIKDIQSRNQAEARKAYWALTPEERLALDNPPLSQRSQWLTKFSAAAGAFWFKVQGPATWFFRFIVGAAVLAGLVALVVTLIRAVPGLPWGDILTVAWESVAGGVAIVLVIYLIAKLIVAIRAKRPAKPKSPVEDRKPSVIKAVFASIHDHTCANVKVASPKAKETA